MILVVVVVDDVFGIIVLMIFVGINMCGSVYVKDFFIIIGEVVLFFFIGFFVGIFVVKEVLKVLEKIILFEMVMVMVIVIMLIFVYFVE